MDPVSFRQSVRKRPGMYVGDPESAYGANHVVFELVANILDQFLIGKASRCEVIVQGFDITISDDGPGLPFGTQTDNCAISVAEYNLEHPHFGATAHGHAPHVHLVFNGVGLAVVNALCSELAVVSGDGRFSWSHTYQAGLPYGEPTKVEDNKPSGTKLVLHLDQEILQCPPDPTTLHSALRDKSYLFPGFELIFNGSRFVEPKGLLALAELSCDDVSEPSIWRRRECEDFLIDVALVGNTSEVKLSKSWINGSATRCGGTHQLALERAQEKAGWTPMVSMLHVIMLKPQFAGPTKDELSVPSLEKTLETALFQALTAKSG